MAGESRQILIEFVADVKDINKGAEAVKQGMGEASGSMDQASKIAGTLKTAAINAGVAAAQMALEWAIAGVDIATTANKVASNFENVFGPAAESLSDEVEDLAGHMGLAEYEAQQLLAETGALAQSMGMSQQEAADYSAEMLRLAGDMAAFNPEAGNAADAMEAMTKAANGSTKGMAEWGVSLKSAEVTNRALADSGKTAAKDLTQEEKALATLNLITEKQAAAQGTLNENIEAGNTEVKEAKADIDDMQVAVGNALMPIKKLALQGFLILADILIALEPAIVAIGELLEALLVIIKPLLSILSTLATILGGEVSKSITRVSELLAPLINLLTKASESFGRFTTKVSNFKMPSFKLPSFHSGGTVPGAPGSLQPIMAQGGEQVSRPGAPGGPAAGGGGGTVVNITVNSGLSSSTDVARTIVDMLTDYTQSQGPIDVKVTGN
jgi:hypothetical protein